jgi:hypothetical protein
VIVEQELVKSADGITILKRVKADMNDSEEYEYNKYNKYNSRLHIIIFLLTQRICQLRERRWSAVAIRVDEDLNVSQRTFDFEFQCGIEAQY